MAKPSAEEIARYGLPQRRAATIRALARAVADGTVKLDGSASAAQTRAALLELPGIEPWSASYVAMRALVAHDAFRASYPGVMRALRLTRAQDAEQAAERWRPWRAYAVMYLWQIESNARHGSKGRPSGTGPAVPARYHLRPFGE